MYTSETFQGTRIVSPLSSFILRLFKILREVRKKHAVFSINREKNQGKLAEPRFIDLCTSYAYMFIVASSSDWFCVVGNWAETELRTLANCSSLRY